MQIQPARTPLPRRYLNSAQVREMFAGISDMTLYRWVRYHGFPRPLKVNNRNLWDEQAVLGWADQRAANQRRETAEAMA